MPAKSYELHGVRIFECSTEGTRLRNDRDAVDLITSAWEHGAKFIVIPAQCLGQDFFGLRTRIAGEIAQKFVTYRVRVAIVGDISRYVSESSALRDFVGEANRGKDLWFAPDIAEVGRRLETALAESKV